MTQTTTTSQFPGCEFDERRGIWVYGNTALLDRPRSFIRECFGEQPFDYTTQEGKNTWQARADMIEHLTEKLILGGVVLICAMHNAAHQRAAVVPLRWGLPRIMVLSGGFYRHLGSELDQEPFITARLWRYNWDPKTDLAVSLRAPDKLPTYARLNPTVDRLIERLAVS